MTSATFYVIDSLDKAPDYDGLQLKIFKKLAALNAHLFITSRPLEANVEVQTSNASSFWITPSEEDLELHTAWEMQHSPSIQDILRLAGPSLGEEIVASVKKSCGGM